MRWSWSLFWNLTMRASRRKNSAHAFVSETSFFKRLQIYQRIDNCEILLRIFFTIAANGWGCSRSSYVKCPEKMLNRPENSRRQTIHWIQVKISKHRLAHFHCVTSKFCSQCEPANYAKHFDFEIKNINWWWWHIYQRWYQFCLEKNLRCNTSSIRYL